MVGTDKRITKMRRNPRDWRIEDLQSIADFLGIEYRTNSGSHVVFRYVYRNHVTIPAKRPIKSIYIKQFLELVDSILEEKSDESNSKE